MNEYIQPLRFYTDKNQRLSNREVKGNVNQIPLLIMPLTAGSPNHSYLMPFFIIRNRCYAPDSSLDTKIPITIFELIEKFFGSTIDLLSSVGYFIARNQTQTTLYYYDDYIYHAGKNLLSDIPQGVYSLHIADGNKSDMDGYTKQDWYSEYFRIGYFTDTIKFEYRNSYNVGHVWFPKGDYYSFNLQCISNDPGEFFEYKESQKDINNYEFDTYNRIDKLRSIVIMGDSNIFDCLKLMQQFCDDVWITDETGFRGQVKINSLEATPNENNYMAITVKYYYLDNSIISTDKQRISEMYQIGPAGQVVDDGLYIGDHEVVIGNTEITL